MNEEIKRRILICAPYGKDAQLSANVLAKAGLTCVICKTVTEVVRELTIGADVLLTMDDVVSPIRSAELSAFVAKQPGWSDLPILVLKRAGANEDWYKEVYDRLGNITILDSPIRPSNLISAVRASVRARERQYEIRKADQRKDEFLAMLGHELRNPLAPIGAAAQVLQLAAADSEKVKTVSQMIARQVRHMKSLVDDLLDVARVTRGLVVLDSQLIDLREILSEASEQVAPMINAKNHEFQLVLPAHAAYVQGDKKRLVQVFSNVIQNAAKYTPDNGKIAASLVTENNMVVVDIVDNGVGMTTDVIDHVFDLFTQAKRSADRSLGGLGIGLSLVENLVKSHGGSIRAWSEGLGKGSKFSIQLPLAALREANGKTKLVTNESSRPTMAKRILVVDDNEDGANALAMVLQMVGYDVTVAYTAAQAIKETNKSSYDIGLLDIGLPDMTGYELAKVLRKQSSTSSSLLIAVTGYGQQDDLQSSQIAGFDHHFVKPVDVEQLVQLLSTPENASS